ncbi:MAG TPA: LysR family transcriptional regulator [Gemmatimonadales bacterium]
MAINLHHLRIFWRVAELGGFSRAAEALRLSQPAVSKSVRELERQLQTPLFDRTGNRPRLTDAGERLLTRARELFAVERLAEEELRTLRGLEGGVLRIAASTTIVTYLLPSCLARFHAAHPGVALRVWSANTRDVARALAQRRVEIALVEGPVDDARLEVVPWRRDELVVIAHPQHPLVGRRRVTWRDLADERFIVRERGSGTRQVAEEALARRGVEPRVALQLASTEAIKQAVAAGLGLAIVSGAAIADQLALGRLATIPVDDALLARELSELRYVGRELSPAAHVFREMLGASGTPLDR